MVTRAAKVVLLLAVALYYTLVVFNNIADPGLNIPFVQHVLSMDSTLPDNHSMWRAMTLATPFFVSIIGWESVTMGLCWWGGVRLLRAMRGTVLDFNQAKKTGIVALVLGLLMWFVAFTTVRGEWFLMWTSPKWNGEEAAFRMFTTIGIVLLFLTREDTATQP